jgi:ribosomal protein S13
MAAKTFKRKLNVINQKIIKSWDSGKGDGKETHLWKVEAVDENGMPIEEELRSFAELELNILIEYEVETYESARHGVSYTVKKPRANTTARVGELERQLQSALERLAVVEERLGLAPPTG